MSKKCHRALLFALFAVLAACVVALAACGGSKAATYSLTWDVPGNAVVTVEGYDGLPDEWEEDTEIAFTVTCDAGYSVSSVRANNTALTADAGGRYTRVISRDTAFTVTLSREVASVEVTTPPANLTYHAGESLDRTGMVVTVTYSSGDTEEVTGYTVSPSVFSAGDASFTVSYANRTSSPVALDRAVTALITVDPYGGTIANEWISLYGDRDDIEALSVTDGVVTIEFLTLEDDVTLPTMSEITYLDADGGVKTNYSFSGWRLRSTDGGYSTVTSVRAGTTDSCDIYANWSVEIVEADRIWLEETTHDGVYGPYLVLDVTFLETGEAYLYLYEGNSNYELRGDPVPGREGESATLYFNLSELGHYVDENGDTFEGAWMDVRFNSTSGIYEYTQNTYWDADDPIASVGGAVRDDDYSYTLLLYSGVLGYELKVAYRVYNASYDFEVDTQNDELRIFGSINAGNVTGGAGALSGATVSITMGGVRYYGTVNVDSATWTISVPFASLATTAVSNTNYFEDFTVYDAAGNEIMYGSTANVNEASRLNYALAETEFGFGGTALFGSPSYSYNVYDLGDGRTLYIGSMGSDWQSAFYSFVNTNYTISYDLLSLEAAEDGRPLLVVSGTYGGGYSEAEAAAAITESFYLDLQVYPSWAYRWYSTDGAFEVEAAGGAFRVLCDITDAGAGGSAFAEGDTVYGHIGDGDSNMSTAIDGTADTVTYGALTFTLQSATFDLWIGATWLRGLSMIYVTSEVGEAVEMESVTMEAAADGKPLIVFSGTWDTSAVTAAQVSGYLLDFNLDFQDFPDWTYYYPTEAKTITVGGDGTFTVSYDVTAFEDNGAVIGAGLYLMHNNGNDMDLGYTEASVVYGGYRYTVCAAGESDVSGGMDWVVGRVVLRIEAA